MSHKRSAHGVRPSIMCDMCDYKTANGGDLNRHKNSHHLCGKCDFRATKQDDLLRHKQDAHKLKCDFCDYEAKEFNQMKRHVEKKHEANGSGLVQGKGGDRQSCPGLFGSAWACPPISSIWVEKIEWGVRVRERRRRIARTRTSTRARTSTRNRTRTRTRMRRWTAAYLAKLIRSMPRLSCLSPLHCALHFSTPAFNFQSTFTFSKAFKGK